MYTKRGYWAGLALDSALTTLTTVIYVKVPLTDLTGGERALINSLAWSNATIKKYFFMQSLTSRYAYRPGLFLITL